ncbi:hypothetical protein FE392_12250 [Xenorhabdus sp. 12]|uniref:Uncharacterized protein n=1 Tax=Xenorhabdus santafensis TaxID=2582833 RepID=A0ABU4SBB3_9GAMM|nr:hypothetical protein [Xenorhabdus sp. 12]MDX7988097.1 hypothetical protein [Xenorhabdus sp. 12]
MSKLAQEPKKEKYPEEFWTSLRKIFSGVQTMNNGVTAAVKDFDKNTAKSTLVIAGWVHFGIGTGVAVADILINLCQQLDFSKSTD